jgi:hypothetical protein
MSTRALVITGIIWGVGLAALIWMLVTDSFKGPISVGLFSAVAVTPLYVAKEIWWPSQPK